MKNLKQIFFFILFLNSYNFIFAFSNFNKMKLNFFKIKTFNSKLSYYSNEQMNIIINNYNKGKLSLLNKNSLIYQYINNKDHCKIEYKTAYNNLTKQLESNISKINYYNPKISRIANEVINQNLNNRINYSNKMLEEYINKYIVFEKNSKFRFRNILQQPINFIKNKIKFDFTTHNCKNLLNRCS